MRSRLLATVSALMLPALQAIGAGQARAPMGLPFPLIEGFRSFGEKEGLPSSKVNAVLASGGEVWAGTHAGLARLENGRFQSVPLGGGAARRMVVSLASDPRTGDLWIGTFQGLLRWSAGRLDAFTQVSSGLPNDVVYAVMVDADAVWAATAAGLGRRDRKTGSWSLFDHTNTLMHEPWCYALTRGKEQVYVGVWGGGIVEHLNSSKRWKEHRDPDGEMELDLLPDDGPIHDVTSSVSYSDGLLWQGTYFGLSRYDGQRWRSWVAEKSPLPSNFINYVAARGRVAWIATDDGLCATDGKTWASWKRDEQGQGTLVIDEGGARRKIPTTTALPNNELLGVHPGEREIWIATSGGVARGAYSKTSDKATGDGRSAKR